MSFQTACVLRPRDHGKCELWRHAWYRHTHGIFFKHGGTPTKVSFRTPLSHATLNKRQLTKATDNGGAIGFLVIISVGCMELPPAFDNYYLFRKQNTIGLWLAYYYAHFTHNDFHECFIFFFDPTTLHVDTITLHRLTAILCVYCSR